MRTTITIDDDLMHQVMELTGRTDRNALIREGLQALVALETGRRLAALGGSDPEARKPPRRRSA